MPTGYTADVQDGKITELNDFIASCAKNFVLFIHQRDDSHDAPLTFDKVGDYSYKHLKESRDKVNELVSMTDKQIEAAFKKYVKVSNKRYEEALAEKAAVEIRYASMLNQVMAWDADPNSEVQPNLKKFMIEQLRESMRFDCTTPEKKWYVTEYTDAQEWHDDQLKRALEQVERDRKYLKESEERVEGKNREIQMLFDKIGYNK